uniref:Putative secreted protein n=1 Tax=Anopheles marajoara TaxID=58244 RepID=A0A2M4C9J9_9DIPT
MFSPFTCVFALLPFPSVRSVCECDSAHPAQQTGTEALYKDSADRVWQHSNTERNDSQSIAIATRGEKPVLKGQRETSGSKRTFFIYETKYHH